MRWSFRGNRTAKTPRKAKRKELTAENAEVTESVGQREKRNRGGAEEDNMSSATLTPFAGASQRDPCGKAPSLLREGETRSVGVSGSGHRPWA